MHPWMMDIQAGRDLLDAHGLHGGSSISAIVSVLASDDLFVKHEDVVLASLLSTSQAFTPSASAEGTTPLELWRCVRFPFLSNAALQFVQAAVRRSARKSPPAAAPSDHTGGHDVLLPLDVAPFVAQQLILRSTRQADQSVSRLRYGHYAFCDEDGAGEVAASTTPASAASGRPRKSYCFTVDVHGESNLGCGTGLFFIWVDPADATGCNDVALARRSNALSPVSDTGVSRHGIPSRYQQHIAEWGAAYGTQPTVFNGAQCLLAVTEASSHPEFRAVARRVLDTCLAASGESDSERENSGAGEGPQAHSSPPSLLEVYTSLARAGCWIQCVDIARLAIVWLAGGGSVYLDTDMGVGTHRLPPPLACARPGLGASAGTISSATFGTGTPLTPHRSTTPLLVLAQDADGLLQNNFIASVSPFHPFLTLLLQAIALSAVEEGHVVKATGPAMLTAVLYAFQETRAQPSPSMLLCPPRDANGNAAHISRGWSLGRASAAVARLLFRQQAREPAEPLPPVLVPAEGTDAVAEEARSKLPAPLPESSFQYLSLVPRVAALPSPGATHEEGSGWRPLESLHLRDTVHVCPPSTFYPRHWRDAHESAAGGPSASTLTASPSSDQLSADAAEALALRQLVLGERTEDMSRSSSGDGAPELPLVWMPDICSSPEEVASMSRALRAAMRGRHGAALASHRSRQAPQPPAPMPPSAGHAGSLYVGGNGGAGGGSAPLRIDIPGSGPGSGVLPPSASGGGGHSILFGIHGWDCTWGGSGSGAVAGGPGPGAAHGASGGYAGGMEAGYTDALDSPAARGYYGGLGGYASAMGDAAAGYGSAAGGSGGQPSSPGSLLSGSSSLLGTPPLGMVASLSSHGYGSALLPGFYLHHLALPGLPYGGAGSTASGGIGGGGGTLVTGDVFGVSRLALRVMGRMVAAGLRLAPTS